MIFGEFPVEDGEGLLLAHSLRLPDQAFKKGRRLAGADISLLRAAGFTHVSGARLEAGDHDENTAAAQTAAALLGPGLLARPAQAGRCNIVAAERGLLEVDAGRVHRLNRIGEAITVATLPPLAAVRAGAVVATVKIIPLAVPGAELTLWTAAAAQAPALSLRPFASHRAALLLTGAAEADTSRSDALAIASSRRRLEDLGSHLGLVLRCAHRAEAVSLALQEALAAGCSLLLIAGDSVPKDRADTVPAGIAAAGGEILRFGMPVEPGNMLLLARIGEIPVIALPGCARSRRTNGLDWVLQRLHAGLAAGSEEIADMGVGGLIRSAPEVDDDDRPRPPQAPPAVPRLRALVLAAGSSRRMNGENKLLQAVGGIPMVRRPVAAALASRCASVTVVTGHQAEEVRAALHGLAPAFAHNPDHASGMASSLRAGLLALPADTDAVLVVLADMPRLTGAHLDRLLAAFDPADPRIVMPVRNGRRGNPILWPSPFFAEMRTMRGDVGARELLARHAERIRTVEFDDDAIFLDVDTPGDLAAATAR